MIIIIAYTYYIKFLIEFFGKNIEYDPDSISNIPFKKLSYQIDVVNQSCKLLLTHVKGVLEETVFAVGFNDNYIIAKQHPSNNRANTNYYIVPIYKENTLSPEKGVIGALTLDQFNEKRKEWNISDEVTFTKEIEDLK